ncbi:DUF4834 family protein [Prevotella sp.]|uniref:DUF4834 family protein n=1 Tax=Prevotella sp. TaxID=59823 RepID=UPI002F92875F
MVLLKFLIIIFFVIVLMIFIVFWDVIKTMFRLFWQVKSQLRGAQRADNRTYKGHNRRSYPDGESVIDQRSPQEAKQKIFKKDEGEYVDYTEEP